MDCHLSDRDDNIKRQIRALYGASNMLRAQYHLCSATVKNILFRYYCLSMYGAHLWHNFLQSEMRTVKVAYSNPLRILHSIPRSVSVLELQCAGYIPTFDALIRHDYFHL